MPKQILFCLEDLCYGGTQRQTLELALRLDPRRFSPAFLMLTGVTDLDAIARAKGLPLAYLSKGRSVSPFFFLTLGLYLARHRPALLVPCTALPNIWVRIWGKILGIPVLGTCRGGGAPKRQHERFLWRFTSHLICNSEALREALKLRGIPPKHLTCIPNGVDTDFFAPTSPQPSLRPPVILCVARLAEDKDHLTLFRAVLRLRSTFPDLSLRVVGDGPLEEQLKAWARAHPLLPVEWVKGTTDVRPHYNSARLLALSSIREGQPNVLLEAMSSGLPICATAVGGIPALLKSSGAGLLSPGGDEVALAENLAKLLREPKLCDALGQLGREHVLKAHSFTSMVQAHEAVFASLV